MPINNIPDKLYKASLKFASLLHLEETYKYIVLQATKLTEAKSGSILLLQDDKLSRVYASDETLYQTKPRKRDYLYKAMQTKKPLILDNRCKILMPLLSQSKAFGILSLVADKEKFFTEANIRILKLFTPLAIMAIRKAQLYDQSQKALEARDLFISMAAHELRTPLTTINGYAQLLYSKLSKANTPESRWVEDLTLESYRLTQLINELLEINRIKTGQLRYAWVECSMLELLNRAMLDFRFAHPQSRFVLKNRLTQGKDKIIGDYNKLLQVIINLLDNAAKFSPAEREITATLSRSRGYLILEIADRGKGISLKDRPKVYEMFYRGENPTGEGMGVGLFLAKNIITHHHGDIIIKSKKNRGTKVIVKLPEIKR